MIVDVKIYIKIWAILRFTKHFKASKMKLKKNFFFTNVDSGVNINVKSEVNNRRIKDWQKCPAEIQ